VVGLAELPVRLTPFAAAAMGLIAAALAALMMWLAAAIVNVKDATPGRTLVAAMALSVLTAATAATLGNAAGSVLVLTAVVATLAAVLVIKRIYRTTVWKAAAVLILNAMMQLIISSLYVRAVMGSGFPHGPS